MHGLVGVDRVFAGLAADGDIRSQKSKSEGESQNQVDQNEQTAAVLGCKIGESPEISDADGTSCRRHDKAELPGKTVFLVFVIRFSLQFDYLLFNFV